MMASGQILSVPAFPPPASHPPSTLLQPLSPFVVFFCTMAASLQIAAASTAAATGVPPYLDGLQGYWLIPWLSARVRLRRGPPLWIAASPLCTDPCRDPPDPPPDHDTDPSVPVDYNRSPDWLPRMSDQPPPDLALGATIRSSHMDLGEERPLPQSSQTGSQQVDRAILQGPADQPNRAGLLLQSVRPNSYPKILLGWPQLVGRRKMGWTQLLCRRKRSDRAQLFGPFAYA